MDGGKLYKLALSQAPKLYKLALSQSDRICAITIDLDRVTLLVIGVYLPTSDCTLDIYNDHLIEVEALINNHPDCCVIIGSDFNAHVAVASNLRGNSSQNSHGNLLSNMVCRNDMFSSSLSSNSSGPCYTYFSGDTRTTTDYFIVDACLAQFIQKSSVLDHHPLNFSDHLPLMMSLSICPSTNSRVSPTYRRLNWKRASTDGSVDKYTSTVNNLITPFVNKVYSSAYNLDTDVVSITHILQEAAVASIPLLMYKKKKKCFIHDRDLKAASNKAKEAWKSWCNAGRPSTGALFDVKKKWKKETQRIGNLCKARLDRQQWQRREDAFKQHNSNRFHFKLKKTSMGNKLSLPQIMIPFSSVGLIILRRSWSPKQGQTPTFRKLLMKWKIC